MENLKEVLEFIVNNASTITSCVILLLSIIQIIRKNISWENKLTLVINTLKDEKKMLVDGKVFSNDTMKKIEEAGEKMNLAKKEILTIKKEIANHDDTDRAGIKIGTHKGKPIYLRNALGIFSRLKGIF